MISPVSPRPQQVGVAGHRPTVVGGGQDRLETSLGGGTEGVDEVAVEGLDRLAQQRGRHRRSAVDDRVQLRVAVGPCLRQLQDRADHRGHQEDSGEPSRLHPAQDHLPLELRQDQGREAPPDVHEDHRLAGDVEDRRRGVTALAGQDLVVDRHVDDERLDHLVRLQDPLRQARGARGERETDDVAVCEVDVGLHVLALGDQGLEALRAGGLVEVHEEVETRDLLQQRSGALEVARGDEQHARLGAPQQREQLGGCEPVVERHVGGAQLHAGEHRLDVRGAVGGHHRHAVALGDAPATHGVGEPVDPGVGLGEGLLATVREEEAGHVRDALSAQSEEVADADIRVHVRSCAGVRVGDFCDRDITLMIGATCSGQLPETILTLTSLSQRSMMAA